MYANTFIGDEVYLSWDMEHGKYVAAVTVVIYI